MFQANFQLVPDFTSYECDNKAALTEIASNPTKLRNSSLAIQLCYDWIRKNAIKISNKSICDQLTTSDGSKLSEDVAKGLLQCFWPGRCQVVVRHNITFHIDGAHTVDSLKLCVDWFNDRTKTSQRKKILIFNSTGERDAHEMLNIINGNVDQFYEALFTPNISSISTNAQGMGAKHMIPMMYLHTKTRQISNIFGFQMTHIQQDNRIVHWIMRNTGHNYHQRTVERHLSVLLTFWSIWKKLMEMKKYQFW